MKKYVEERFTGERALFQSRDLELDFCTFADGESPLKESSNLKITNSLFQWKYPLWYCDNVVVEDSTLFEMGRAGIWYTNHLSMKNITIEAPKTFRRCNQVTLENVDMPNAEETLWNCQHVSMKQITAKGNYFGMGCSDVEIDGLTLVGNYSFDGGKNITIRNSKLLSKDAFWNCENVTVYDSFISGQYFGWNAKNVTLINCTVESDQGMCYMDNIVMKNCKLLNTDLAFEYSTVDVEITGKIDSVKNPYSGRIQAREIGEIIFDNPEMKAADTEIIVDDKNIKMVV
ncbi:MAG: DUF3737 family protein [Lachnospiraceae bacterium]|jgi:hypothetical protein|nr:DUF3737 family protein [Lachnospiraceae bacterium]MDD3615714.1 DUF3737 family protein [Lachnospiraceae bacterium]